MGDKIKEVQKGSNITVTKFAEHVGTSRENIYAIFKRKSIDSDLLATISKVLDHDFFIYLVDKSKLYKDLDDQKRLLGEAGKEIDYLKRINSLLEDEVARYKTSGAQ